jgi:hypothetical protein
MKATNIAVLLVLMLPAGAVAAAARARPYDNPEAFAWTRAILDRVAPRAGLDPARVKLTLLDAAEVNAFADAQGNVSVTRGLLEIVEWDDELAAVIGHEIAHVSRKHISSTVKHKVLADVAVNVLGALTRSDNVKTAGALAGNLTLLKYSRKQESEADDHGMRYMAEAGFSPRGMVRVMQKLGSLTRSSKLTAFLSSHPEPGSRVAHNQKSLSNFGTEIVSQPLQLSYGGFRGVAVPLAEGAAPAAAPATAPAATAAFATDAASDAGQAASGEESGETGRLGRTGSSARARSRDVVRTSGWRTVRLKSGRTIRVRSGQ